MKKFVVAAAVAGLALTACSSGNTIATVNGRDITLTEFETIKNDLEAGGGTVTAQDLLSVLIMAEASQDSVKEAGLTPSPEAIRGVENGFGLTPGEYSETTKEFVDAIAIEFEASQRDVPGYVVMSEAVKDADVDVAARFGQWNDETLKVDGATRDYLETVPGQGN